MLEHVVVKEEEKEGGCSAAMLEHVVVKEEEKEGGCSAAMLEHVVVEEEEEEEEGGCSAAMLEVEVEKRARLCWDVCYFLRNNNNMFVSDFRESCINYIWM